MPQALLNTGEDRLFVATLEVDDAVGFQTRLGKRRREQVWPGDTPEHFAPRARCNAGRKECGGGAIDRPVPAASDFMQRTAREPTVWKARVHCGETEGQHRCATPVPPLDLADLGAQGLDSGQRPHV